MTFYLDRRFHSTVLHVHLEKLQMQSIFTAAQAVFSSRFLSTPEHGAASKLSTGQFAFSVTSFTQRQTQAVTTRTGFQKIFDLVCQKKSLFGF